MSKCHRLCNLFLLSLSLSRYLIFSVNDSQPVAYGTEVQSTFISDCLLLNCCVCGTISNNSYSMEHMIFNFTMRWWWCSVSVNYIVHVIFSLVHYTSTILFCSRAFYVILLAICWSNTNFYKLFFMYSMFPMRIIWIENVSTSRIWLLNWICDEC